MAFGIVKALSRRSALGSTATEHSIVVEIRDSSEGKAHQGTGEDENCVEISILRDVRVARLTKHEVVTL